MPIEFHCTHCNTLLRVPDDAAGRQAKCPKCANILMVPEKFVAPPAQSAAPYDSTNPYASPASLAPAPVGGFEVNVPPLDLEAIISRTWEIFKVQWGLCTVAFFLLVVMNSAIGSIAQALIKTFSVGGLVTFPVIIALRLAAMVAQHWLTLGQAIFFINVARGGEPNLGDLFRGGPYLLRGLGAAVLIFLVILGIALVCIGIPFVLAFAATREFSTATGAAIFGAIIALGPAIWVSIVFSQTNFLIVDRNMGAVDALKLSAAVTSGNRLTIFVIWLVLGLLGLAGVLLCCVGIFGSLAFTLIGMSMTYLSLMRHVNTGQSQV